MLLHRHRPTAILFFHINKQPCTPNDNYLTTTNQYTDTEDGPFTFGRKRGRSLQEVHPFPAIEFDIPVIPRVAPEYGYFTLDTCSSNTSCNKTLTVTHSATFVNALQLCLGTPKCGGVLFDPVQKQTTLCTSLVVDSAANKNIKKTSRKELDIGHEELQCIATAQKKLKAPPIPCPGDRHQCLVFEALELQSGFNDQAQLLTQMDEFHEMWGAPTEGFRAYNPGMLNSFVYY